MASLFSSNIFGKPQNVPPFYDRLLNGYYQVVVNWLWLSKNFVYVGKRAKGHWDFTAFIAVFWTVY